ncbi:response regulator transcription factor [Sphingobacterium mizutaii]|uniref:response regulator transcription factor n=1 Tax=Sphingobacterium mizutaii TaxID=1010 RepID=UPI0028A96B1A|nr:response regulator [Sphingobacterium mizutaii]
MSYEIEVRKIILLVDDHQEILDFLTDDLCDDYDIVQAHDGYLALEVLEKQHIDLIVSDVMMPKIDGFELCSQVKKNQNYKHIPFILLTAKNSLQAKIEGLEHGADAYIEKPFSPSFLQAQIRSLLKNRMFVKQHYAQHPEPEDLLLGNSIEEDFMDKLQQLIVDHIDDTSLCVEFLADKLNISRPTLYRKIKQTSNLSPNELINNLRLKKASQLLNSGSYKVYEISNMVGFSSSSHFIRNFQKHFGYSPKEWEARFQQEKLVKFRFN